MIEPTEPGPMEKPSENDETENLSSDASHLWSFKPPDQDVYRTPTTEDFVLNIRKNNQSRHHGKRPTDSSNVEFPLSAFLGAQELNLSELTPQTSLPGTLGWQDRIRHFTWTFFSMTMATGGIANVLFTGNKCPSRSFFGK